jgi:hypothetical protein
MKGRGAGGAPLSPTLALKGGRLGLCLHHRFTDELGKHYREVNKYRNILIEEVNKSGISKRGPSWKILRDHHLLVDVPYVKHDQYGSVAIKYPPSVEGTVFYRLNAVSQLKQGDL